MKRFPGVTPEEWERISEAVERNKYVQAHQLAVEAGITRPTALAVMARLATLGAAEMFFVVYHGDEETPMAKLPYSDGLPDVPFPFTCDVCDVEVEGSDELKFDILIEMKGTVTFE